MSGISFGQTIGMLENALSGVSAAHGAICATVDDTQQMCADGSNVDVDQKTEQA